MAEIAEIFTITNGLYALGGLIAVSIVSYFLYETFRFKGPRARIKGRLPIDKDYVRQVVNEILVPVLQKEVHISGAKGRTFKPDGPSFVFRFDTISHREQLYYYHSRGPKWIVPLYSDGSNTREIGCLTPDALYLYQGFSHQATLRTLLNEAAAELKLTEHLIALAEENAINDGYTREHRVNLDNIGERQALILDTLITSILTPTVRKQITVHARGGTAYPPLRSGGFHIHMGAWPRETTMVTPSRAAVGGETLKIHEESVGSPSGSGDLLFDDSSNAIGELQEDNLYLYETAVRNGTLGEARYLIQVLKRVQALLSLDKSGDDSKASHFADQCLALAKRDLPQTDSAVAQQELTSLLARATAQEKEMFHIESNTDVEAGKEFDALLNLEKVIDVKVDGRSIVVTTKTLYCQHPRTGDYHEIGAFDIHIFPGNNSLVWKNRTRMVDGGAGAMNAPHVNGEGNACFGNTAELFPKLIADRDFATAAMMAIAFVESINIEDSWGKYLGNWPVAINPPRDRSGSKSKEVAHG